MKRIIVLCLISLFVLTVVGTGFAADRGYANPQMLINAEQLKTKLDAGEEIRILDVTKKTSYMMSHIPGATQVWGAELTNPDAGMGGIVATKEGFEELMGKNGISNDSHVVVYDHSGGLWATRVIWMMKLYGHHKVQLLDGGIDAWKDAGYDVNRLPDSVDEVTYEAKSYDQTIIISTEEVAKKLDNPNFVMIDTRSDAEYNGEKAFGGAPRKGHIPGAIHIEWNNALNEDGTIKSASDLKALYESHGVTPEKEIAMHCHSAVRSAHTWFALRLIGYSNVKNYDPSWIGWSNSEQPIE